MKLFRTVLIAAAATCASAVLAAESPTSVVVFHAGPSGDIRALHRTGDTLWVGTADGLFRYNTASDAMIDTLRLGPALPSSSVRAITSRGDSVFVGTDEGLVLFRANTIEVLAPGSDGDLRPARLKRIRSIDFGLAGEMYVSTLGFGVGVVEGDAAWAITREDSLLDNKVYRTIQARDSTFYFATSMGLCAYRDSVWVNFQAGARIPRGEVRGMTSEGEAGVFILVAGKGIYSFDGHAAKSLPRADAFNNRDASAITVDRDGGLWAAGRYGGVAVFQNGRWAAVAVSDPQVRGSRWQCAGGDAQGVFFGSADGTILLVDGGRERVIQMPRGLAAGRVGAFASERDGTVFFLNAGRVLRTTKGVPVDDGIGGINALAVSPFGGLWVAGRWGVFRRDAEGYHELRVDTRESDPVFVSMCFDRAGSLWVGTRSGALYRYDGELWMRVGNAGEVFDAAVDRLVADPFGGVFAFDIGADRAARYLGGRWVAYGPFGGSDIRDAASTPNGVALLTGEAVWEFDRNAGGFRRLESIGSGNDEFRCFAFDPAGRLYLGTRAGVVAYGEGEQVPVAPESGLGGGPVASLLAADDGTLWVGFEAEGLSALRFKTR